MKFYQSKLLYNILFFSLGLLLIIFPTAITSVGIGAKYSIYPDLFLCFVFASALNRPRKLNLYSILLLLLLSDVLHMKPIGLLTMIVLTCFIAIERYESVLERLPFYIHYFIFLSLISFIQVLNIFIHYLLFIPNLSLVIIFYQAIFSLICYPLFDIPYRLVGMKKR